MKLCADSRFQLVAPMLNCALVLTSPSVQPEVGQISWQWRPFPLLAQMWHTFSCSACITFCSGTAPTAQVTLSCNVRARRPPQLHFGFFSRKVHQITNPVLLLLCSIIMTIETLLFLNTFLLHVRTFTKSQVTVTWPVHITNHSLPSS